MADIDAIEEMKAAYQNEFKLWGIMGILGENSCDITRDGELIERIELGQMEKFSRMRDSAAWRAVIVALAKMTPPDSSAGRWLRILAGPDKVEKPS